MKTLFAPVLAAMFAASLSFLSAEAADSFRVTPYVQHPTPHAMSLLWLTPSDGSATVEWWPEGNPAAVQSAVVTPREATELGYFGYSHAQQYLPSLTPWQYRCRIEGLEPDTRYAYRVTLADGGANYSNVFRTAPDKFRPVRFVAYSDSETQPSSTGDCVVWENYADDHDEQPDGWTRKYYIDQTAGYASNLCCMISRKPDFFVVAGDLAEKGSDQTHWDEFWRHNAGGLNDPAGSTPILAAPGNHEYHGYFQADDFGERGMLKYLSYFEYEPNGAAVDADQQERFHRVDYGPVALIFLDPNNGPNYDPSTVSSGSKTESGQPNYKDTNQCLHTDRCRAPDFNEGTAQYRWLEEQLADASTNRLFTFIVCHQCPFSCGYHGRLNGDKGLLTSAEYLSGAATRCLTNLVFKYGVDAWICGHDEIYEHSRVSGVRQLPGGGTAEHTVEIYDVGIGGDGLRGCRRTSVPNPYEVFRAHVDAPEVYDAVGTLLSGGKHYGHLEVDVSTNELGQWTASLTPAYVFVSKNGTTGELSFERRTYEDVVTITKAAPANVLRVPAGTAVSIASADDVAKFAALDAIVFEEGDEPGRIDYTAAEPLVLKATLSGPGVFAATGAGQLTLLGDNSGLVAPGHFAFTNTLCVVSNEFGLGSSATAPMLLHIDNASVAANRTAYSPRFGSETGVFTNHVAIHFDTLFNLGSESMSERLVQDGDLHWIPKGTALNALRMKGNFEMIHGKFDVDQHFYTGAASGYSGTPTWTFSGDSEMSIRLYIFGDGVEWFFNSDGNLSASQLCSGTYHFCREQAFVNTMSPAPYSGSVYDLGGFDQVVGGVNFPQYGSACISPGSTSFATVTSAEPAMLSRRVKQAANLTYGFKFTGKAGFQKDFADDVVFVNHISDSKGELKVNAGSLTLDQGAGWGDGAVTVTGGKLVCTSVNSMNTGKTSLEVTGGQLVVDDAVGVYFNEARIGGTELADGKYSVAELAEQFPGLVAVPEGQSGTGFVQVTKIQQWDGWPEEPGQAVTIPLGTTVVVTDADAAKVSAVCSLTLMPSAKLIFSNETAKVDLKATVVARAAADVSFVRGAYVILEGDNSDYVGKTRVDATSTLIVSNRYGLGRANATPAVVVENGGTLLFGGNGLTNDVPLDVYGDHSFQVDFTEGPFVQNAKIQIHSGAAVTFGDAILNGPFANDGASPSIRVKEGRTVAFNGSYSMVGYFKMSGKGTMCLNSAGSNSAMNYYNYESDLHIVCGCENAVTLGDGTGDKPVWIDAYESPVGCLDLNGYDQRIPVLHFNSAPKAGDKKYYPVVSDRPATLRFCQAATKEEVGAPKFMGQASFEYAGQGKYTLRNIVSTSKGTLTVSSGTVELTDGAGWTGDINVTGGKLILSSFYSAGADTTITVSGDGELNIPEGCKIPARRLVAGGRTIDVTGRYPVSELQIPGVTGGGEFWVGNELYVSPTGSDANDGFTRETPKKTLQTVLDTMCVEGTTVYLLPGVYSNGVTRVGTQKTLTRVVVPKGVALVGLGDKSEVVIAGEAAPVEKQVANTHGCGEDAVRCLYLKGNATIRNLTLTQGHVFTDGYQNQSKNNEYQAAAASAVTDSSNTFIDCIISNNYANVGAGLSYATLIRCRVCCNVASWYASGAENSSLYNCIVDHNSGAYPIHHCVRVVNCTLGPGNSQDDCRYSSTPGTYFNTLMMGYVNIGKPASPVDFYRTYCSYAKQGFLEQGVPAERLRDGCKDKTDGIQVVLDGDFRVAVDSCLVDAGNADYLSILPANYADEAMKSDFYGNPRALGASVDIGAVEYDWRKDFAADLGRKVVVTDATVGVVETEARTVAIPDGGEVVVGWKDRTKAPKGRIFRFNVADGTLTVKVNGEAVAAFTANGEWTYRSGAATDRISFSFVASEEDGTAELLRSTADTGALLLVR